MKTREKLTLAYASVLLTAVAIAIVLEGYYMVPLMLMSAIPLMSRLSGCGDGPRDRDTALCLSIAPGLGHIYLGERLRAIPFLAGTASGPVIVLLMIITGDVDFLAYLILVLIFYMPFVTDADVRGICDRIESPECAGQSDGGLRAMLLATAVMTALTAAVALISLLAFPDPVRNPWLYAASLAPMAALTLILAVIYRRWRGDDGPDDA